jgi:hypothetical protein
VKRALWLLAAAVPLAAQPKLLTNAQTDTRSAAAGLAQVFRSLPASAAYWAGYEVPAVRTTNLGCQTSEGVVHLEPPDRAVILLRVEAGAVEKIRAVSPYCEIDAGGLPVHWLTDVKPLESVAFLGGFVSTAPNPREGAVFAIAVHSDPTADAAIERFIAPDQPQWLRLRAVPLLGSTRGPHGVELLSGLIANDRDEQVRRRAISALGGVAGGEGIPVLIQLARTTKDSGVRKQAMGSLQASRDPRAVAFFEEVLKP